MNKEYILGKVKTELYNALKENVWFDQSYNVIRFDREFEYETQFFYLVFDIDNSIDYEFESLSSPHENADIRMESYAVYDDIEYDLRELEIVLDTIEDELGNFLELAYETLDSIQMNEDSSIKDFEITIDNIIERKFGR